MLWKTINSGTQNYVESDPLQGRVWFEKKAFIKLIEYCAAYGIPLKTPYFEQHYFYRMVKERRYPETLEGSIKNFELLAKNRSTITKPFKAIIVKEFQHCNFGLFQKDAFRKYNYH